MNDYGLAIALLETAYEVYKHVVNTACICYNVASQEGRLTDGDETNLLLDKAGEASDGLDDRALGLLFAHEAGDRPPVADLHACLTAVGEASMAYIAVANSADAAGE
jgi:hypothetical protein